MTTTKKKSASKSSAKKASKAPIRSFTVTDDRPPFMTFRITQQTFYWVVIGALILALGIWVLTLTIKLQQVYDEIDMLQQDTTLTPNKKHQ